MLRRFFLQIILYLAIFSALCYDGRREVMTMERKSGVLLPLFSLPGDFGCGTMGDEAKRWIDFLREGGFSWWQVLPLGMTDFFHSPYASCSSFGGNYLWIDPEEVFRAGLVTKEERDAQRVKDPYLCDYETLEKNRLPFLKRASSRVKDRGEILDFLRENPLLEKACFFFALRDLNGGRHFREWLIRKPDPDTLFAWQFIQYEFHRQWKKIHDYAKEKGISILGDLPIYVSADSFDLYHAPELFQLSPKHDPAFVAGVPPDYFSRDGQLWGNPLYDWDKMAQDGFSYWKERLSYTLSLYDGVRIDHFRALAAYWRIPAGAESAREGEWVKGPGKAFIDAVRPLAKEKLILAEDLGIIDDDTRDLLRYSSFPGMAVIQFAFDQNPGNTHLPHNYEKNLVAYTGTHDNNTLLGFWWEMGEDERREAMAYLGDPKDPCDATLRALWMSPASLVIVPVQDLLGYGADTRINTPGRADGNWRYRVTREQLRQIDKARFRLLNHLYSR